MTLIYQEKELLLDCDLCGEKEGQKITVFAFSASQKTAINCSCGCQKAVLEPGAGQTCRLHIPCVFCDQEHTLVFDRRKLWEEELLTLSCPETGCELGWWGDAEHTVKARDEQEKQQNANDRAYFTNPVYIFEALNHLHDLHEEKRLFCCCGNQDIQMDLYQDRLELRCDQCGCINHISVEKEEDWQRLTEVRAIELGESGEVQTDPKQFRQPYRLK